MVPFSDGDVLPSVGSCQQIADRLCASIGQDILDCLFSRSTLLLLSRRLPLTTHTTRPVIFFLLATLYTGTTTKSSLLLGRNECLVNSDACIGDGIPNAVPECRHKFVR